MDCRETQTLLTAFHDGELPAVDRARVEKHLRGCPECGAMLADLARVDQAAGVPDPGPAYWDRFNASVMDRVERKADGPKVAVLRPKRGWVREQLRYLVPAAAAAALVVVVVRYGGMDRVAPAPAVPPAVSGPAAPISAGPRMAKADPESDGQGWPSAGAGRDATGSVAPSRATKKEESSAVAQRVPPPSIAEERLVTAEREERGRLFDRPLSEAKERTSRDRAAAPAGIDAPSPAAEPRLAAKAESAAASPCELARTLAERERFREAEDAQRACLAQDRSAPAQEKGLVFLAELLDRQERFAEADAVITEVDRQFPQSRPLDLYRQQRTMVQKQPTAVPVTR
jgi:anti-sigma factor RsiW